MHRCAVTRLVFVDRREDAAEQGFEATDVVVAVTAAAADALEARGASHRLICDVADARKLAPLEEEFCRNAAALSAEIEAFVAAREPEIAHMGPGWLTGLVQHLQYSLMSVAVRSLLMRQAIRSLSPNRVVVFRGPVDPWFAGDGYELDPWIVVLSGLEAEESFQLDVVEGTPAAALPPRAPMRAAVRVRRYLGRRRRSILARVRAARRLRLPELEGGRILFVGGLYDWTRVVGALARVRGATAYSLRWGPLDEREWQRDWIDVIQARLHDLGGGPALELDGLPSPLPDEEERTRMSAAFDAWLRERGSPPSVDALGTDIFRGIEPHLRVLVECAPALARHADAAVEHAFRVLRPEVVCAFALTSLPGARLSLACRRAGVPVITYQHGGRYGVERLVQHEIEFDRCDRFLTYGEGIHPLSHVLGGQVAQFISVGSTQIERMRGRHRRSSGRSGLVRALVLGESSLGNTLGASFVVEDTERYRLERKVVEVLARSPLIRVTYRPYPWDPEATAVPAWIARERIDATVAAAGPFEDWSLDDLLGSADVAITDLSSGTVWNQAFALDVPLVLYYDPRKKLLADDFADDLEQACLWCWTPDDLVSAVRRLAADPQAFLTDLRARDTRRFLERYVLHRDDGRCVERALEAIAAARRANLPA